jgi:RNA polymerase sigma-70 factor (ECF subfamily)
MSRDEAELLAKAGRGDQTAFTMIYQRYESDLYRFTAYLAHSPDVAEELFQETWFRVVKNLGKKPVASFKKWIFAIATNLYRDELRKRKVSRLVLGRTIIEEEYGDTRDEHEPVVVPETAPTSESFAIREALTKAMRKLTPRQRTVFVLTYIEGFKIREASEILGKAEGTVKSTLYRALEILRAELKDIRE